MACVQAQSCLTLCTSKDYSLPSSAVPGIFQARILEWLAISYSKGSSPPRVQTRVSGVSCTGRQILFHCARWEAPVINVDEINSKQIMHILHKISVGTVRESNRKGDTDNYLRK